MFCRTSHASQPSVCPDCGRALQPEGEMLRCSQHGLFFHYGPRLLVHVAERADERRQALLPWQTLTEKAIS